MEKAVDNRIQGTEDARSRAGLEERRRHEESRAASNSATRRRMAALVFLFYLCAFLFLSGGRLSSGDAESQLQQALTLVHTGGFGTTNPPRDEAGRIINLWIQNRQGLYYEAHDIGNVIIMLPAAAVGALTSKTPPLQQISHTPILSKFAGALTTSVVVAVCCLFMFRLFALFYSVRTAFLLSLAFATTTFIGAYSKAAYDVSGAAAGMAILLYLSARVLTERRVALSTLLLLGASVALVSAFRYSMAPMLVVGAAGILYYARERITRGQVLACALAFLAGMMPTFLYNYVRMGSPFIPATTHPFFVAYGTADLSGNIFAGLYGLLISPNRGVFWFAPTLLLLFWLPSLWKRLEPSERQLVLCYGASGVLYTLLIAKIRLWGAFGYGPRYMVPLLPMLFFAAGTALALLWKTHKKPLVALLAFSVVLNLPPLLVNWHRVTERYPHAQDMYVFKPSQQMGMWNGLFLGLQGKPLPASPEVMRDPIHSIGTRFPDLWTVRLMQLSRKDFLLGLAVTLALLGGAAFSWRRLTAQNEGRAT